MSPLKNLLRKGLSHRFGTIFLLLLIITGIFFATRLILLVYTGSGFDFAVRNMAGVFGIGLLYDLGVASYIMIPFVLHVWFINEKTYSPKWRPWIILLLTGLLLLFSFWQLVPVEYSAALHWLVVIYIAARLLIFTWLAIKGPAYRVKWRQAALYVAFFVVIFLLLFNAVSEYFFWNEFSTRYNFIAVDYLVYTTEVMGNIRESYPIGWIIAGVLVTAIMIVFLVRKSIARPMPYTVSIGARTGWAVALLILPVITFLFMPGGMKKFSGNAYANELAANGLFEFGAAFNNNELDFYSFYRSLPDKEAFNIVRKDLAAPNVKLVNDTLFSTEHEVHYTEPERKLNVVLISVESFNADFMKAFGNKENITPRLDSLAEKSLLFTNLYASGTRTVRGLEALALSIPPTPGQSVVKRPNNGNMFSLGAVFRSKGYKSRYIYGGYSYFDNMNAFFSGNQYEVTDRRALSPGQIHYANIWGVADEDLFTLTLQKLDEDYKSHKPFFAHVMTVSNHRPFTYPEGKIDIPPSLQKREGAVKYTDYAIGKFINEAHSRPWFNNTVFVIVADHCAGSAGKVELPVTGYHIPMLIYSPANIAPGIVDRLTAQIDVPATILGLLKFNYRSKFFGQDILSLPPGHERAFISTYQGLGFLKDGQLVIQSPIKSVEQFKPDFTLGNAQKTKLNDSLAKEAIAYYQCAGWLLKHREYKWQ